MYLESVHIENLKCFEDIDLEFKAARTSDEDYDPQQNWNVILGNNGDGKTTLLQAIAVCLMDEQSAQRVVHPYWVRTKKAESRLTIKVKREVLDLLSENYSRVNQDSESYEIERFINDEGKISSINFNYLIDRDSAGEEISVRFEADAKSAARLLNLKQIAIFSKEKRKGWISSGYGPFRRIYGVSNQAANITNPLQERFISLFDEGAALYKYETWLKDLQLLAFKNGSNSPQQYALQIAKRLILDLLPQVDEIDISEKVRFLDNNRLINLNKLSDGYRSMFALIVDLLRWLEMLRSDIEIPLNEASGVVLIDEIDTHLHPKWQREIGFWLTKLFPNIQFIVTTHSPFVAMAAGKGALTVLRKNGDGESIVADQEHPYIRDWAVNRVLNEVFHVSVRSWETEQDLDEYEKLRVKQIEGKLDEAGQVRLATLKASLNTRLAGDSASPERQSIESDLAYLKSLLKKKREQASAES